MANPVQETGYAGQGEGHQGSAGDGQEQWVGGDDDVTHPAGFNKTPEWMIAGQHYVAQILATHGFLVLALAVAVAYLWPVLQRKARDISRGKPATAAPGVARDASSAAASGDVFAEQRRRAVESLQAKLEEETKTALEEKALREEVERKVRLEQLNEEAKRMGLSHSGQKLGTGEGEDKPPKPTPAPQPVRRSTVAPAPYRPARIAGFNPLDSTGGGGGGFRSSRNTGRG